MHSGNGDLVILKGQEVSEILDGRELELMAVVRKAYETHAGGDVSLPNSTFLRFPSDQRNRIIALPAYLGQNFGVAGIKWVSSFPDNIRQQLDRASAVVILNSTRTGRPEAIIEGSIISAKRTAASAALAAHSLANGFSTVGFIGCGVINFEIARFLLAACPELQSFFVYDLDEARARQFSEKASVRLEVSKLRSLKTWAQCSNDRSWFHWRRLPLCLTSSSLLTAPLKARCSMCLCATSRRR